ncbi:MAG: pirin family protein [Steroidobacteraceae bacterium]
MSIRTVNQIINSINTSDGAGVKLLRSLGQRQNARLDPFLMLDEFCSFDANDYIAGFPPHPHRGFETVTYMLEGHMLHEDHMGNKGHLRSGDVQWMTAAHGIIHSEMPQQQEGRMHGFQLWINLPAREKMKPASYRDIPAAKIPQLTLSNGAVVKIIAGQFIDGERHTEGSVQGLATQTLYLDVHLPTGQRFAQPTPLTHNAFVYVYEGEVSIGDGSADTIVNSHTAAILTTGDSIVVTANHNARFLLLAAKPLNEPVVQYGPFVMNTREEIEQAVRDYQNGTLVQTKAQAFSE